MLSRWQEEPRGSPSKAAAGKFPSILLWSTLAYGVSDPLLIQTSAFKWLLSIKAVQFFRGQQSS